MANTILLLIGLIIFLLGLYLLKTGLSGLNNINLKQIIYKFTQTPFLAFLSGTLVTILLQSSSAVTVITIGLVDTGLMTFAQAVGIVLGTNIGTTITGQIMAFNLEKYGLPLIILGTIIFFLTRKKFRFIGLNLLGLGFIFIGMSLMGQALAFIKGNPLFFQLMLLTSKSPLLAILLGTVFTAIIQSSSAMTGIVLVLAKNGQIDLLTATAIILGSNIGTCITAILASLGSSLGGKRVAMAHVVLNILGVIIFFPFLNIFTYLMTYISDDLPRQVANTQMFFNIISSLAVLPFSKVFARFICWLLPVKKT